MALQRIAFKMKLTAGYEQEYKRRHDEIWPELADLLKQSGISDYSIFLDSETNTLFAYLQQDTSVPHIELSQQAIVKKWWKYMADIMDVNEDLSPVQVPLSEVFHLP